MVTVEKWEVGDCSSSRQPGLNAGISRVQLSLLGIMTTQDIYMVQMFSGDMVLRKVRLVRLVGLLSAHVD